MHSADIEALQTAVVGLNERDVDPIVALMDDTMMWKGFSRGWFWWRHTPT